MNILSINKFEVSEYISLIYCIFYVEGNYSEYVSRVRCIF